MHAIKIKNLEKSFDGQTSVLKNINLSIPEGEIFGFLGPNGSGKTTTVRILNGLLSMSSGHAEILNNSVAENPKAVHRLCGVMTETAHSYRHLTTEQNLRFFGNMHEMEESLLSERIEYLISKLELREVREQKVQTLSTGMKKRVSLAIALIHDPKVLFLDEPTSGLDPESARNVTGLIKNLATENKVTVFLCTHQLKYAEEICSLYGFIHKGELLGFGTFDELAALKQARVQLTVRGNSIPSNLGFVQSRGGVYAKHVSDDEEASAMITAIVKNGGKIFEAKQQKLTLEELYFMFIKNSFSEEEQDE